MLLPLKVGAKPSPTQPSSNSASSFFCNPKSFQSMAYSNSVVEGVHRLSPQCDGFASNTLTLALGSDMQLAGALATMLPR